MANTESESVKTQEKLAKVNQKVTKSFAGVVKGLAGTSASVVLTTKKTGEYGKYVDATSKRVGMSTKAFQQWDYIMSQNNGSADDLIGCMNVLNQQITGVRKGSSSAESIFKDLGVSVRDANGCFRTQEAVFADCINAIQGIQNPTEKAIMSQRLLGEEAGRINTLLNNTSGSVQKLKSEYASMGIGLTDEDIAIAVQFSESMDKLGKVFELAGMQLGVTLLPYVQQFADIVITNMPAIRETLIPVIQGVGNLLGFCVQNLNTIIPLVIGFVGVIGVLRTGLAVYQLTAVACLATNPFVWVAAAIAGITTLISVVSILKNKMKENDSLPLKDVPSVISPKNDDSVYIKPKRHALGTSFSSGGLSWVGENGPELINLRRGDSITPADKSAQIASGGNTINISMNVQGNLLGNREFFNEMMNMMAVDLRHAIKI